MIRNFTTLNPLFASVNAHFTKLPLVSPHGAPHDAFNRLHENTYMVKYEEAIKYVGSIFILRQKMRRLHLLPSVTVENILPPLRNYTPGMFWLRQYTRVVDVSNIDSITNR